jgi:hypothetical protein
MSKPIRHINRIKTSSTTSRINTHVKSAKTDFYNENFNAFRAHSKMTNRSYKSTNFETDLNKDSHASKKIDKYHYHLKHDRIYGDKKLKLCGQCATFGNLSTDLNNLTKFMRQTSVLKSENQKKSIDFNENKLIEKEKISFKALDLTTERHTGLNMLINDLPKNLFKFKHLKRLHLDCNRIKSIPDELGQNLHGLEILTLSHNKLKILPQSISNLKHLTSLHLSNNRFETVPDVVFELKSLRFLDVSSNQLIELSTKIGLLKSLETLLLFENCLTNLPEDIGKLQQLRTLWLGNNKLKKLPRDIVKLNNLEWNNNFLDLSSNIDGNPLVDPPLDICLTGIQAIRDYFGEKREIKREKVYK